MSRSKFHGYILIYILINYIWKSLSLETKLSIINRVEKGEKKSAVSLQTGLFYSTISTTVSQSKKIKTSVENNNIVTNKKNLPHAN